MLEAAKVSRWEIWVIAAITLLVFLPWVFVKKVKVTATKLSNFAMMLEFTGAAPAAGTFGRISHSPLGEYHSVRLYFIAHTLILTFTVESQPLAPSPARISVPAGLLTS